MVATTLDEYFPFAVGAGSNVTEAQWKEIADAWLPTGIVRGVLNEFAVSQRAAGANASIDVATGEAVSNGHRGRSTSIKNLAPTANATGNPRIDTVVVRFDWINDRIELDIVAGTAAVTPVSPTLTQDLTTKWEEPLADLDLAAGYASVVTANIRDRRQFTRTFRSLARKEPCRLATTSALAASTVVGSVRTANANGALAAIDSVTAAAGDRILDTTAGTTAGPWQLVDPGAANRPWIMVRPRDFDTSAKVRAGCTVEIGPEGTINANTSWQLATADTITLGTTSLTFKQTSALVGVAQGDTTYFDGTNWKILPKSTDGKVLTLASSIPSWAAGGVGALTDAKFVRKTVTESVTSSTTMQDDDELTLAVAANSTYLVFVELCTFGAAAGDIATRFVGPAGDSIIGMGIGSGPSVSTTTDVQVSALTAFVDSDARTFGEQASNSLMVFEVFILRTGVTAGNVKMQWAQAASSGTASQVQVDSWMLALKVA